MNFQPLSSPTPVNGHTCMTWNGLADPSKEGISIKISYEGDLQKDSRRCQSA